MIAVRKTPCPSCPYRRDVPSGIWDASEYDKLPGYDGDVPDQLTAGAFGLFHCHSQQENLCAGWVGCHDMARAHAVEARDFEIIPALIKTLALQDPRQAEVAYESMMAVLGEP